MSTRRSFSLVLVGMVIVLLFGSVSAAYASTQTYSGDVIQMIITDTAGPDIKVKPSTDPSGPYITQYFSDSSWGSVVWLNDGGTWASYGSGSPLAGLTAVSNVTNVIPGGTEIVTVVNLGGSGVQMTQTFTHMTGDRFVSKKWVIHNGGSTAFTGGKFYHGGDTFFGNNDSASGFYDASKSMVYLRNGDYTNWGIMGFYANPGTPADRYFEGSYGTAIGYMSARTDPSNTVNSSYLDAGYCLEWDHSGLAPGATWTIQAYEVWTPGGALQLLAPGTQNAVPDSTVTLPFTVQNLGNTPLSLTLAASSVAGWATAVVEGTSVTVPANGSVTRNVQVTVPSGATGSSAVNLVASGGAVGTAATTLNVVNVDVSIEPASVDFGSIAPGGSAQHLVTVTNNSGAPVTFGTVSAISPFGKGADSVSGATLADGASLTVMAAFSSSVVGAHSGSLSIPIISPVLLTRTIPLSGAVASNRAPVAVADSATTAEDTVLTVATPGVLGNDTDADSDPLTAHLVSDVSHGLLTLHADGSYVYTPAANYNGPDSFTYRAYDGALYSNTVTVSVTVTAVNDAPVAVADSVSVTEDEFVSVSAPGVLANDPPDIEGSPVTAYLYTSPSHGTVVLDLDGSYTYTPYADYFGADTFSYRGYDGTAFGAPAVVTVTVNGTPDAPVTVADSYITNEDTALNVSNVGARGLGVLANDIDVDLEPLTALLVTDVQHGTLTLHANGSFTYVPDANWYGTDSFEYNPYDGALHGITISVPITVNSVNDAPVAAGESYSTDEDTQLTVAAPGVLANDSDPVEHSPLTAVLVSGVSHGVLGMSSTGGFTYTPAANYHGTDSFTYHANDGTDFSNTVTVDLTVNSVNDAPVAVADSYTVAEDGTLDLAAPGVMDNDSDADGDSLTAEMVVGSPHGAQLLRSDGSLIYQPSANYNGPDWITYRVYDGTAYSNTATITLNVTSVNDVPVATADSYSTDEDTQLVVGAASGVLSNDSDPVEGSPLSAVLVSGVSHGFLAVTSTGGFTYTPDANYNGPDSFTYHANDGTDFSNTVTVSLTVNSVNDLPVAVGESYTTAEDTQLNVAAPGVLANDSDPVEHSALTAARVTDANHGHVTLFTDGQFVYTPDANYNGSDSFTYRAYDGSGYSNTVTVSLTVTSVYDPPVAMEDTYTTDEDVTLLIDAPGLLGNDLGDGPLSVLSWHDSAQGTAGTVTCWGDGRLKYVPAPGFHGVDTFVYRITDGINRSAYVTVTINVTHVNHAPVANDDANSTLEDLTLHVSGESNVLANDTDHDGDELTAVLVSDAAHGDVTLDANGDYTYSPDANWNGTDSFTYDAYDGQLHSVRAATVEITVSAVNDAPVVQNHSYTTDEDTALSVEAPGALAGAYDVEIDPFTATLVSDVSHGELTLMADGSFSYVPAADFNGTDSFTFRGNDQNPLLRGRIIDSGAVATVTITVVPVNDAPTFTSGGDVNVDEDSGAYSATWATAMSPGPADESEQSLSFNLDVSDPSLFSVQPAIDFNGDLTFTPAANANGKADIDVTMSDNGAPVASATGSFSITIKSVNDAPVAAGDSATTDEDTLLTVDAAHGVLANDTDVENGTLATDLVRDVAHGDLELGSDGSYTYLPDLNWNGEDSFTYRAYDGADYSNTVTVTLTVNPVNDAPVAESGDATTDEDTTLTRSGKGSLRGYVSDVEDDAVTIALVTDVEHGSLDLGANGNFTYEPDPNWNGTDSFAFKANDGQLDSNVATFVITVDAVNDAPVAVADAAGVDEDTLLTVSAASGVLSNDTDVEHDTLSAALVSDVAHGELTLAADGSYTYMPDMDWNGTDSFTYQANDGDLDSSTVTVTITVAPVNDVPSFESGTDVTVAEDSGAHSESAWATIILAGPGNESAQKVHFTVEVSDPSLFSVQPAVDADGKLTFTPAANAHGAASCTVTLSDDGSPARSTHSALTITVTSVNDAPVAHADSATTAEDTGLAVDVAHGVLSNDTDVEGDALHAVLVRDAAHGTLVLNANGSYTYAPHANWNGDDSFTYKANDGALDSGTVTVSITVTAVNDAPVAVANSYSTSEDHDLVVSAGSGVLRNDSDVDGDTLSATLVSDVDHGSLDLNADGSFSYSPDANWHGSDSFTYRAGDGHLNSGTVTVTITVTSVNDAPVAHADVADAVSGTDLAVDAAHGVLSNDTDAEGDELTASKVDGPAHGTLTLHDNGSYEYSPASGFSGSDAFTYRAYDGTDYSDAVSVSITVVPANPTATSFAITSATATKVKWTRSAGATGYRVYLGGVATGTVGASDTSFTIPAMLGPGAVIDVQAIGGDETRSHPVRASNAPATTVRIGLVYFVGDSPALTDAARKILRANAALIKLNGFKTLTVEGFTSKGPGSTAAYRAKLSTARANAVRAYLLLQFKSLHITVSVKAIGMGYARPIGGPTNSKNRRAEISVR